MEIRHWFYVQPMEQVYIEAIAMFVLWTLVMLVFRGKARRVVSVIGVCVSVLIVLSFTLIGRGNGSGREVELIPFITFAYAKAQPEFYRTLFMNMLLFLPLGLCLPFALPEKVKRPVVAAIIIGAVLSLAVEIIQLAFGIGKCETDDLIMNVLGTLIGAASYLIVCAVNKHRTIREYK